MGLEAPVLAVLPLSSRLLFPGVRKLYTCPPPSSKFSPEGVLYEAGLLLITYFTRRYKKVRSRFVNE
jgi:hypothetical protein